MEIKKLELKGLACPVPSLKMTIAALSMKPGDVIEAIADCPSFEKDVRAWCERAKKSLLWVRVEGNAKRCQVRV